MKNIPNLQLTLKANPGDSAPADAATLLKLVLANPPQGGFDLAAMRARNRVLDVLEKTTAGGTIDLEDADYATARNCVEQYRWGGNHPDILKFAELFGL
jgi:hypothetical protein